MFNQISDELIPTLNILDPSMQHKILENIQKQKYYHKDKDTIPCWNP